MSEDLAEYIKNGRHFDGLGMGDQDLEQRAKKLQARIDELIGLLRCHITGNPCGTDTVMIGAKPDCPACEEYARNRGEVEEDPTPWCHGCGSMTEKDCHCGPICENH
jgi:hypothetical protein